MMKQFNLGVVAVALLALPFTASAQSDITGPWVVSIDSPQGKMDIDATFKQAGEKITGEVSSPMGSVDFTGTLIKNELLVTYSVAAQGQSIEIRMTGLLADEAMSGTLDFGGMGQAQWTAKRKPAGTAPTPVAVTGTPAAAGSAGTTGTNGAPSDVSGKWNITVQMGANALPMTGMLTQQGETVTGTISTPVGELPVTGTMVGKNLKLQFTAQTPQGDMAVTMTGELGPEGLVGKSSVPGLGESDWTGKRVE